MVNGRFVPNPKRACLPTVAPWKWGDTHPVYSSFLNPLRTSSPAKRGLSFSFPTQIPPSHRALSYYHFLLSVNSLVFRRNLVTVTTLDSFINENRIVSIGL
jgi:hypothetical protein